MLFFCYPFPPCPYSPELAASQPSQPLSATYHHILLWILTPVWCMPFVSLTGPVCTQTAYQSCLSLLGSANHWRLNMCHAFCFWMSKHQLQSLAGVHFLFHHATQSVSCFPCVRRSEYVWHVLLHVILKAHARVYARKSCRIRLCVCYVTLASQGHWDANGPAVWSTHHVWFISIWLQNNRVAAWLTTCCSPPDIITQADMAIAAAFMDCSFCLYLRLRSKWGVMHLLPADAIQKLPRSRRLAGMDVATTRKIFTSGLFLKCRLVPYPAPKMQNSCLKSSDPC